MARILLLNGVGSAGKSALARALQTITAEPFLHVQMDSFLEMLPDALQDHPDGFSFESVMRGGQPEVIIETGPVGARALRGMRRAVAAMAAAGNNLIVDDVMLDDTAADYREVLTGFQVSWVGVFAPLAVLEARERQRGDRLIGLARWQFHRVHRGISYDLEVDSSSMTPMACARLVRDRLGL